MIFINFVPYHQKNRFGYFDYYDWVNNMRVWLNTNCGQSPQNWEWKFAGALLEGVYIKEQADATAFRLVFNI